MKRRNKNIGVSRTTKQRKSRLGAETLEPRLVLDSGGGADQQTPLSIAGSQETDSQKFVQQAFHDLLGRAADPGGLQYWASKLDSGAPQGDIARQLTHSDEYYSTILKPAFLSYLGRPADSDGLKYWISRMRDGLTDEHLEAGFIGSTEFYAHAGGTDEAWVKAMYVDLLGRPADATGVTYWTGKLAAGGNRSDVAYGFAASLEREQERISGDYEHYLHRAADNNGLKYWVNQFAHGVTNEDLIAGFVGSPEYFHRAAGTSVTISAHLAHDTGSSNSDSVTSDPTIVGQTVDTTTITRLSAGLDGATSDQFVDISSNLAADGDFSLDAARLAQLAGGALAQGAHTLHVRAEDAAGNVSSIFDVAFTVDTQPPTVAITSPADGSSSTTNVTLSGHATDSLSGMAGLQASVDGRAPFSVSVAANGNFSLTTQFALDGSDNGPHVIHLVATDAAGNVSAPTDFHFTLAAISSPAIRLDTAAPTQPVNHNVTLTGEAVGTGVTGLSAAVDSGAFGSVSLDASGNFSFATSLPLDGSKDGAHTIHLKATDSHGAALATADFSFTLDTVAPSLSAFDLSPGSETGAPGTHITDAARVTLNGQAEPGVQVSLVGTGLTALATGSGAFTFTNVSLPQGDTTLTAEASDAAGNKTQRQLVIHRNAPSGQTDPVIAWNQNTLAAIQHDASDPLSASRGMAMVQSAVYDAVNAVEGKPGHFIAITAPAGASAPAAVAQAAHDVLVYLFPAQQATFDAELTASLGAIADGQAKTDGVAVGSAAAAGIVALRANDGWNDYVSYVASDSAGAWQPTAPMYAPALKPQWASLQPWVMASDNQFDPAGPPALDSQAWADAVNQVKSLGAANSTARTADQTQIARFWSDGGGTATPPGHWNEIADQIASSQGNSLDENARLFAELDSGLADAAIVAWNTKFDFNTWRPIAVIQDPSPADNPSVTADPTWQPLLVTPNFPEYISGHSTFSGTAAGILDAVFGANTGFTIGSDALPGVARSFTSFDAAASEAGISRIYGGIHFMFSNTDGLASGHALANYVVASFDTSHDTTPPKITITNPKQNPATQQQLTVTGQALDNLSGTQSLTAAVDGGSAAPVTFDASGKFTFTTALALDGSADGPHVIHFQAVDYAGNASAPVDFNFTLDSQPPVVGIASPGDHATVDASSILAGKVTTASAIVSLNYKVDGGQAMPLSFAADGSFSQALDVSKLAVGDHALVVTATNAAGSTVQQSLTIHLAALAPLTVKSMSPDSGASDVGVTYRPLVTFSRAIDVSTLTSSDFYATDSTGAVVPATIVPAGDGTFAWLFFTNPLPGASTITITLDGSQIKDVAGNELDAADNGTPGSKRATTFTTVNSDVVPGTSLTGIVADPGLDLLPDTTDDVKSGADGVLMTADDVYKLPIAGVKLYILGHEDQAVTTAADGSFTLSPIPTGDVKLVVEGRTATNAPAGYYFPEMVMDLQIKPGVQNTVMAAMAKSAAEAAASTSLGVYLPRLQTSLLQNVDSSAGAMVTTNATSAPNLTDQQRQALTIDVAPNSIIGPDGKPLSSAQIGISTVPSSLVADMLPPGVLEHTFDITVQALGVTTFSTPAPMTFPNVFNAAPGTKLNFLSFDHTTGRLVIEGTATVSADGQTVTTDPGTGVTHPGWHGLTLPGSSVSVHTAEPCEDLGHEAQQGLQDVWSGAQGVMKGAYSVANMAEAAKEIKVFPPAAAALFKAFNVVDDLRTLLDNEKPWYEKAGAGADLLSLGLDLFAPEIAGPIQIAYRLAKMVRAANDMKEGADAIKEAQGDIDEMVALPLCDPAEEGEQQGASQKLLDDAGKLSQKITDQLPKIQQLQQDAATIYSVLKTADPTEPNLGLTSGQLDQLRQGVLEATGIVKQLDDAGPYWGDAQPVLDDANALSNLYSDAPGGGQPNAAAPNGPLYWEADTPTGVIRGRTDDSGKIDFFAGPNQFTVVRVYNPKTDEIGLAATSTAAAGSPTTFSGLLMLPDKGADTSGDGLSDEATSILGITPQQLATTLHGVNVGAELQQGLDPFNGAYLPTGMVSRLALQGEAKQVVLSGSTVKAQQQTAYVATGSYGLAIVEASRFTKPAVLGQLQLPGDASGVSVDPVLNIAAVADGSGGLAMVDVSDPTAPKMMQTIAADATQVVAVDGVAYATVGSELRAYDMLTGDRLQSLSLGGGTITGLAREGTFLYTVDDASNLHVIDISHVQMAARGSLSLPAGGGQLFVGGGIAYVSAASNPNGGFQTVDVSNPDSPRLLAGTSANSTSGAPFGVIAANGSGRAVVGNGPIRGVYSVQLYNVSDSSNTGQYITQFALPLSPQGVAIGSGVAFVADSSGGLAVVNYLPFDTQGVAPSITVDASSIDADVNTPGIQAVEGSLVTLKASVSDDVQVRNVELLVNGQVVKNNVSFPFDLSTFLPTIAAGGATATLQVQATDTGGNTTASAPITVNLLHDTTPPTIVSQNPRDGGTVGQQFRAVVVDFSEPLDPATISAADFALTSSGGTISPEKVQLRLNNTQVQVTFPAGVLALGDYHLVIHAANITDRSGNPLGASDVTSTIHVSQYSEVWTNVNGGDWNDPNNWDSLRVPQPGDNVLINVPGNVTITYAAGDTLIRSLVSNAALTISGGSFSATQSIEIDNQFTISGGTLEDTVVLPGSGGQPIVVSGGTLTGVTFNNNVNIPAGGRVYVANGLTMNGTLTVGDNQGGYASLEFDGTQTLAGNGDVNLNLGDLISGVVFGATETLTLGQGITLHGFGGTGFADSSYGTEILVNHGTIRADNISVPLSIGWTLINDGLLSVAAATQLDVEDIQGNLGNVSLSPVNSTNEYLKIDGKNYVIDKGITAPSESTVVLFGTWTNAAGSTISADGATLVLGGDPGVVVTSTWSNGGTISGVHGSQITLGGNYTLSDIGTLTRSPDTTVTLAGTLDLSPVAPSGLTAATGANYVMLHWSDNSTKEAGYEVERSTDGVHFTLLGTVAANVNTFTDLGATVGAAYSYRVRAYNAIGDASYSNAASATPGGASHGLLATFYNSGDFSGPIVVARTEPNLNDSANSAGAGITAPYTARWQGQITAAKSEAYTFDGEGHIKVWVNGQLVVDNDGGAANPTINLIAGQKYSFLIEDSPPSYDASLYVSLYWSSPSTPRQLVPADAFYMPASVISGLPANVAGPVVTVTGGATLQVSAATGDWNLSAMIVGGTIATSDGAQLIISGGTLDGVTLNSDFSVPNLATLQAVHGLTVNGNLTVGAGGNLNIDTADPTESLSGSGQVTLAGGSLVFTASGPAQTAVIAQGMVVHGAGDFGAPYSVTLDNQGTVRADVAGGMLRGFELQNDGLVAIAAGSSIGLVGDAQYNGGNDLTLNSDGSLNMDIGGTDPSLFGQIKAYFPVGNSAIVGLGGALNISFVNGFQPTLGDSFKVIDVTSINGQFATINVTGLPSGLALTPVYGAADLTLVVGSALHVAPNAPSIAEQNPSTLQPSDAAAAEQAAIDRWAAAGLDPRLVTLLRSVDISVAHLGNDVLAITTGNRIIVSDDADGFGWFIDPTPADDSEFSSAAGGHSLTATPGSQAAGRVDLLTVLMHELGHELGLDHLDDGGLMDESLSRGERRTPSAAEVDAAFAV